MKFTRPIALLFVLAAARAVSADGGEPGEAAPPVEIDPAAFRQIEVLMRAIETVREQYVDEDKVGYDQLIEGALEGMFARLDRHSQYMSPRLFEEMRSSTANPVNTSGMTLGGDAAGLKVVSVVDGGPAGRAGVRVGDTLLSIRGKKMAGVGLDEATALLDGKPGTLVTIEVERPDEDGIKTFGFAREAPPRESVNGATVLPEEFAAESKIGYVHIRAFEEQTARELADALDSLEGEGIEALVLDLRDNPGGLIDTASAVCGEFLPPKSLVAKTLGRPGTDNSESFQTPAVQRRKRTYPLAVLINGASASSAEIVAGALQDHDRALVVGEKSFGKGSVQTVLTMGLGTGAAMRLTTARFFTPDGHPIDAKGIRPDIEIPGDKLPIAAAAKALARELAGAGDSP